jgi:hypothetical protein
VEGPAVNASLKQNPHPNPLFNNKPPFQQPLPLQFPNPLGTLTEVVEKTSLPKATPTGSNLQNQANLGILKKLYE